MKKQIDISKSVYEICTENPDIIDIMKDLGFESITNPACKHGGQGYDYF